MSMKFGSWRPTERRFDRGYTPEPNSGCWLWLGFLNEDGYGYIRHHAKQMGAHRYSYMRFNGPIPEGMYVCHTCDVPSCVNPDHLFLGTQTDNMRDMERKGRGKKASGEAHSKTYLTEQDVRRIREMLTTMRQLDVSRETGINISTIHNIKRRRTWAHVD